MGRLSYLAMLLFTVCGSFWLEIFLKVGVLKRWRNALIAVLPVGTVFLVWDAFAISRHHWRFDVSQILGIFGPGGIPLEEFLFFVVVPFAAILTIEAVRSVKPKWLVSRQ